MKRKGFVLELML